ncbi:MAG: cytochrome P450 [Nannocystaceae bacterium]|nr:cytochrome P450 [Myxococcales bacterium]
MAFLRSTFPKAVRAGLPPMIPGGLPVLGHIPHMSRDPIAFVQRGRDRFGDLFCMRLPGRPTVVMTGHAAQERFFRMRDDQVSQREAYQFTIPVFGKGIAYDAEPQIMKEQMGFFHAALRESRLRAYCDGFMDEAERMFTRWGDEGIADMRELGNELTFYTSSRSLLGLKVREQLSREFAALWHDLDGSFNLASFVAPNAPLPAMRRRDRARAKMGAMVSRIIDERRASGHVEEDILQTLMESTYKDGTPLSHDEITGLLITIMFAGHHTSGVTFAWTAILLSQHPEVTRELIREQEQVLGDRETVTLDDLRAMHKLEWTIKETLRLYPPLIMLFRKVLEGFTIADYTIPAGAMIMACPSVAHRIPEIFANPHSFDPSRYAPDRAEDKKFPYGHIAFGAGRHRCMGMVFALLQLRAVWSHLLRNYEFELVGPHYRVDYTAMIAGPDRSVIRYRRRRPRVTARSSAA